MQSDNRLCSRLLECPCELSQFYLEYFWFTLLNVVFRKLLLNATTMEITKYRGKNLKTLFPHKYFQVLMKILKTHNIVHYCCSN